VDELVPLRIVRGVDERELQATLESR
jgi:hypothetical protein